jgi:hypothetical protein
MIIYAKFCNKWFGGFRGEGFLKKSNGQTDDGRKVMAIAHLTLGVT